MTDPPTTLSFLRDLIGFPTVSRDPNRDLIDYCASYLRTIGASVEIITAEAGRKANLFATIGSIILGTLAALGLSSRHMPYKGIIMATLISPMIVPLIISGVAIFFFMAKVGLAATHTGIVLAHIILGTPFVVITVTATLSGFDHSVTRAAASLGSNPVNTFMKVTLPLILPGVISGGLFAFVTSFDEVVVVLFLAGLENTTIPIQMWTGLREQLSPTILAVATCLIILSTLILISAELLRRRSERLRGINR